MSITLGKFREGDAALNDFRVYSETSFEALIFFIFILNFFYQLIAVTGVAIFEGDD